MNRSRRVPGLIGLATIVAITGLPTPVSADPEAEPRNIAIVGPGPHQVRATDPAISAALDNALRAAKQNPDDLGYPWVDVTGELVQRWVTPAGRAVADAVGRGAAPNMARRREVAALSYRQLEHIKDDLTTLVQRGVPDADAIWRTEPDHRHNRIVATVSRHSDRLMADLAARYGTTAVAVHVDPNRILPERAGSRDNDGIPFSGGAKAVTPSGNNCSLGFATTVGFITAGHCAPMGGTWHSPPTASIEIGATLAVMDENYNPGTGSVPLPGETFHRGDIALIRTFRDRTRPYMYVGAVNSTTTKPVTAVWDVQPAWGQQYCTGGHASAENCGWTVTFAGINQLPSNGLDWLRNVNEGVKTHGSPVIGGDSGGPVYTELAGGTIAAKGITSAGIYTGVTRHHYFTSILDVPPWWGSILKPGMGGGAPPPGGPPSIDVKRNDYNRDGVSDIVAVRDDYLHVWRGNGAGGFTHAGTVGAGWTPYAPRLTTVGDINRDGNGDLVAVYADIMHIWRGTGTGGFSYQGTWGGGWATYAYSLTGVGDVNRDRIGDLVAVNDGVLHVWFGTGTGGFSFHGTVPGEWSPYVSTLAGPGDVNRDGIGDLVATVGGVMQVWYGTGNGGFWYAGTSGSNWTAFSNTLTGMGDINRDGTGDLLGVSADGYLHRWYGTGQGGFSAQGTLGSGWQYYVPIH